SAYVYLGGVLVNGRMIRDGYALADPRRGYPEYELFEAYEAEARLRRLGIWKAAGRDNGAGEGR
ncbi:MAG TPA: thermonuclease family protein, partial [Deltaproteobacteria bacterium]|nr:thermonuclease family protein [Deltaproteobacteria bacterium]